MRDRRTILDLNTMQMHLLGPGDFDLQSILPPGSESYQCLTAPSGHMVLPCCSYDGVDRTERGRLETGPDISLPVRATPSWLDSSSSSGQNEPHGSSVPPMHASRNQTAPDTESPFELDGLLYHIALMSNLAWVNRLTHRCSGLCTHCIHITLSDVVCLT